MHVPLTDLEETAIRKLQLPHLQGYTLSIFIYRKVRQEAHIDIKTKRNTKLLYLNIDLLDSLSGFIFFQFFYNDHLLIFL